MRLSDRKEIIEQRQTRNWMYNRYLTKFAGATAIAVILFLSHAFSGSDAPKSPTPSSKDCETAHTLATVEDRESAIDKKYDSAKIIAERTYGKDIISVFEVGYMYSFCVFEAMEDGYWMEYCGSLFPKTELVKGTVYLGDNTSKYDIYLQYENIYSHLFVSRTYKKYQKLKQEQDVHFDENGIGIMKLDNGRYFNPRIIAYDAEGNEYLLDNGGLF